MDFGKVENLDQVDFSLPDDHPDTLALLDGQRSNRLKVYVGGAKWGRKEWVGKIYPEKAKAKDYLKYYAKHFNSIELNATHYRIPSADMVEKWKSFVSKDFKFCPKVAQLISHRMRFRGTERISDAFCDAIRGFENNLGITFLQTPPNFAPKRYDDFQSYVKSFPKDIPLAAEFRHPAWFAEPTVMDETFQMLKEENVASVITDTAGRRDVLHQRLTNKTAFIRFVGNSLHPTDYQRIDDWVERLHTWIEGGLENLYFFMHHHDERYSPELSLYLIKNLNQRCDLNIEPPKLMKAEKGEWG